MMMYLARHDLEEDELNLLFLGEAEARIKLQEEYSTSLIRNNCNGTFWLHFILTFARER